MKKKIVFLDASTVDWGDVDLASLRRLGVFQAFSKTIPSQMKSRARSAAVIITNKCVLGELELKHLPRLRLICVAATGVNNIDLAAARRRGIAVANVAGYSTQTVAEHTLLFLLSLSHRLTEHSDSVRSGNWSRSKTFALLDHPYQDLRGKILGIVGYGAIGREVARLAQALRMKVLIAQLPGRCHSKGPKRIPLTDLLRRSDFVSLHCPLTPQTHHLIYRRSLRLMKKTAFLLNVSRGPLVHEGDVAEALAQSRIAGYAADVLSEEPPSSRQPLLRKDLSPRVLITPHVAWASRESRQKLVEEISKNIEAYFLGRRRNRVV